MKKRLISALFLTGIISLKAVAGGMVYDPTEYTVTELKPEISAVTSAAAKTTAATTSKTTSTTQGAFEKTKTVMNNAVSSVKTGSENAADAVKSGVNKATTSFKNVTSGSASSASAPTGTTGTATSGNQSGINSSNYNNALFELDSAQVNLRNELLDCKAQYQEIDTQYRLIKEQRRNLADLIRAKEQQIKNIETSKNNIRKTMI